MVKLSFLTILVVDDEMQLLELYPNIKRHADDGQIQITFVILIRIGSR